MVVLHFWIILFFKNYILTGWFIIVTYQFTVKNIFFALQMYVTNVRTYVRPCRLYFVRMFGEIIDQAWVPAKATFPFEGGHQFEKLPVLRRRGRQKDKDYKYTVPKRLMPSWKDSVLEAEAALTKRLNSEPPLTLIRDVHIPITEDKAPKSPACPTSTTQSTLSRSLLSNGLDASVKTKENLALEAKRRQLRRTAQL